MRRFSSIKNKPTKLSIRERQVYDLLIKGFTDAHIAKLLKITTKTVKFHNESIYAILKIPGDKHKRVNLIVRHYKKIIKSFTSFS